MVAILVTPGPALAKDTAAEAAAHKADGDSLFDKGRYAEAYEAYERSYGARRDPALLYNMGRTLEAMGDYPEALDRLESFSAHAPADVRAKVPKLAELMADLRSRTSTIHIKTNVRGATLYIRGRDLGVIWGARTVRARAGEAQLRVTADGYEPFSRAIVLTGGGRIDVDAQLARSAGAQSITSKWWFWTAVGAVVLGGTAAAALVITSEKEPQPGTFGPGPIRVSSF